MARKIEYRDDPDDLMKAMIVGAWAQEKHDLLAKYIDGTRSMRAKFHRSTYIELFSGPGRLWLRDHGPFVPGSAVRAWRESVRSGHPFDEVYINDLDPDSVAACRRRLEAAGCPKVHTFCAPAHLAGPDILQRLGKGVHLVLLDPFSIGVLPFSLVRSFAEYEKMDLVVNYSLLDVRRNLPQNLRGESEVMDSFCPGWRDALKDVHGKRAQRGKVLERWLGLLRASGAEYSEEKPLVYGTARGTWRRPALYHIVFASHHDSPLRVWGDVAKDRQGGMFN